MRGVIYGPEPLRRHLRVHLRRGHAGVAQELLHHPYVGTPIHHVRRTRVAQHMGVHLVAEPGPPTRGPNQPPRPLAGEPAPAGVQEDRLARPRPGPSRPGEHGPTPRQVGAHRGPGGTTEGDHPLLAALPVDPQPPGVVIEVAPVETDQLGDAQPALSLIHISEPTRLGMISYAV